jgi:hypothetical protein
VAVFRRKDSGNGNQTSNKKGGGRMATAFVATPAGSAAVGLEPDQC